MKACVSETGDVESVELISGDPILAKSAIDAVKKWKFKPFIKNGKPITVSTKLPFNFAFSENITRRKHHGMKRTPLPDPPATGERSPNECAFLREYRRVF